MNDEPIYASDGTIISERSDIEVEVVSSEDSKENFWQTQGFLKEIAYVCEGLEEEPESFALPARTREYIRILENAKTVEDLSMYATNDLVDMIDNIEDLVPRFERDKMQFISRLSNARTVQVDDIDFI